MIQVLLMVGGNGRTRYVDGEVNCDGPTSDHTFHKFQFRDVIAVEANARIRCDSSGDGCKGSNVRKQFAGASADFNCGGANATGGMRC